MRSKLRSLEHYSQKTEMNDCAWFLKEIKAVTLQFDERKYRFMFILDTWTSFLTWKGASQTTDKFLEELEELKGWAKALFSCCQIEAADCARALYQN